MHKLRRITSLISFASLLFLTACGPDPAVLKSYVMSSRRNHVALMPFTIVDKQVDVRNLAEGTLRDQLSTLGFSVVEKPDAGAGSTVFGPANTPPRVQDVIDYGNRCRCSVVLVGHIERAVEGRPFQFATTRQVQRERRDANGQVVIYNEDVIAHPERPARAPLLVIKLKLFDTGSGHELWSSKQSPIPDEWTLEEAVRYVIDQQSTDLASTYMGKRL